MSLNEFYRGLAAMAQSPDLVRRSRAGDGGWMDELSLTPVERHRLQLMAADAGMTIICTLHRSHRLTALVNAVPSVVSLLGDRLQATAEEFWASRPYSDLQFRSEAIAFCDFVSERFPDDRRLVEGVESARHRVIELYCASPANDTPAYRQLSPAVAPAPSSG